MNNYVVYHLHSSLSLLDSCTNYKDYIIRAKELGQTAICFTEHGNIFNWIEKKLYCESTQYKVTVTDNKSVKYFDDKKKCDKYIETIESNLEYQIIDLPPIKYIHGVEVYLTEDGIGKKIRDNYHTILIAKNYNGFRELNSLIDLSTQDSHFYYKPRITFDEFLNISDNIIKISACLASPLRRYSGERLEDLLRHYDYYEIQPHVNSEDQKEFNLQLIEWSKIYNKPLIAGTDTHSIDQYKAECRSILQKSKKIEYQDEDKYDLTFKSLPELIDMFNTQGVVPKEYYMTAINNTNVMADSVFTFQLDTSFKYPKLYDNEEEVLKKLITSKYKEKIAKGIIKRDIRYKQNIQEEMRVFKKIGMVGFILFMSELVNWCWENNIPVGYCRGSVGGSTIAYITDIIDVNPIVWNTVFSRFANESRKEIGDIDIDISPSQRQLVFNHIINSFGINNTAYVLAIGTISDKGTIDEISRALAEDRDDDKYSLSNTKLIKELYEEDPDAAREQYPELFYYFDGMVNTPISQSLHPAGIIVSPVSLPDNYGTFWNENKRILSINMEEIHEVSLVKYDLLGLKNIEIIKDTCEIAHIPYPKSHEIDWDDQKVWKHITDSPVGIFQFESNYAYELLKRFQPHRINDLSLVNASLRPSGESYRDRLIAHTPNKNPSAIIDDLLAQNHGFLVYQEDVIAFLQNICGLSGSEADNVRRAIGRKQMDRLQAALPDILEGYCKKSDKPREVAEEEAKTFLQIIEDSSSYMFGYNHSTGYSMIGYTCGYLRYYYPVEFITAYLNNANNEDDINSGTLLAKDLHVTINPIKFRYSIGKYSCNVKDRIIYKGLGSIKFVTDAVANEIYNLKDNKYSTFTDLLVDIHNTSCNTRQLNILIRLNFFSEFGDVNVLLRTEELYEALSKRKSLDTEKITISKEACTALFKRLLAEYKDGDFPQSSFLDILIDNVSRINLKTIQMMIYQGVFNEYGSKRKLFRQAEIFYGLYGKKQISTKKLSEYGILRYVEHDPKKKMIKIQDSIKFLEDIFSKIKTYPKITDEEKIPAVIEYEDPIPIIKIIMQYETKKIKHITPYELLANELELLGYGTITIPDADDNDCYVVDLTGYDNYIMILYKIKTGEMLRIKNKTNQPKIEPSPGDIVRITITNRYKWKKIKHPQTGKDDWIQIDEREDVVTNMKIIKKDA